MKLALAVGEGAGAAGAVVTGRFVGWVLASGVEGCAGAGRAGVGAGAPRSNANAVTMVAAPTNTIQGMKVLSPPPDEPSSDSCPDEDACRFFDACRAAINAV